MFCLWFNDSFVLFFGMSVNLILEEIVKIIIREVEVCLNVMSKLSFVKLRFKEK